MEEEYTFDQIEVDALNNFYEVNYQAFWVRLDNNRYVEVIGIDEYGYLHKVNKEMK